MEILLLGNETLKRKALPVKRFTAETTKIAEEMIEFMRTGKGVGLAGPQIGLMERIFVVHVDGDEPRVFVNPSILETSEKTVKYEEGCLSIPGVYAEVMRPEKIKVQAWNERGKAFTIETEGILARVILHEYDHLEGTLFIDRLPEQKRNRVIAKYEKRKTIA
ncbi:MAG: peptide deformylase [Treponema sp.]|jgi:peptide deformylase|nr:peptide deformylase [Treponema sp.]